MQTSWEGGHLVQLFIFPRWGVSAKANDATDGWKDPTTGRFRESMPIGASAGVATAGAAGAITGVADMVADERLIFFQELKSRSISLKPRVGLAPYKKSKIVCR